MERVNRRYRPLRPGTIVLYLFLFIVAIGFIYPLIWLLISSLKTNTEIFTSPWRLPKVWQFKNYQQAIVTGNIGRYFLNSVVVAVLTLTISTMLSSMAAYAIQRMKWKLSKPVMTYFLLGIMIPIHATLIPLFIQFRQFGLTNSSIGLVLPYVVFAFPSTILILSAFFSSIPRDLEEAAVIDGSSLWRAFIQIILPISRPALLTVVIFNFISCWNELLVALVFISNPNRYTLPVGLTNFVGQYTTNYAPMLAAIMLAVLPTIVIYSIFNAKIVVGMTAGAIKA
jgi:raffinose/stachyose/melibiose transport system permease protein